MSREEIIREFMCVTDEYLIPEIISLIAEYIYVLPTKCKKTLFNGGWSRGIIELQSRKGNELQSRKGNELQSRNKESKGSLIVTTRENFINIWSLETGEKKQFCARKEFITELLKLKNNKFASISGKNIDVWTSEGKCIQNIKSYTNVNNLIEMNDEIFVDLSDDKTRVNIWSRKTCTLVKEFNGHGGWCVYSLIKINDTTIACGLSNGYILIYDVMKLQYYSLSSTNSNYGLFFNTTSQLVNKPHKFRLIDNYVDSKLQVWDLQDGKFCETKIDFPSEKEINMNDANKINEINILKRGKYSANRILKLNAGVNEVKLGTAKINNDSKEIQIDSEGTIPYCLTGHDNDIELLIELKNGEIISGDSKGILKVWY